MSRVVQTPHCPVYQVFHSTFLKLEPPNLTSLLWKTRRTPGAGGGPCTLFIFNERKI
jgi:hypothetical protein